MKRFLIPAILVFVSIAVYLPALNFDFVYDDPRQIEMMSSRFTWSQVPSYFTADVWSYIEHRTSNYYRPIFLLWMMLNDQAVGLDHASWHASAILTHTLAVLLLYFLARKLTGDPLTAFVAAMIFAAHPVHIESVAWVSGATESIWAIFFFAALWLFVSARQEPDAARARAFRIGAVACFAIAIFAKETAIVTPALIFGYAWLFPKLSVDSAKSRIKSALAATVPYFEVIVVYAGLRFYALRGIAKLADPWSVKLTLATLPELVAFYARELVWPFQLTLFPPLSAVHEFRFDNFVLPAAIAAVVIAVLAWVSWRNRTAAFCALLMVLTLAPALYVRVFWKQDFVHDRYLYVPSAGFCILLAMGIVKLASPWSQTVVYAALVVIVAVLALFTIRESEPWHDQMSLSLFALGMAPGSVAAEQQLMTAYILQDRYADALPLAEHQVDGRPQNAGLRVAAGICHLKLQHWAQAAEQLSEAVALMPGNAQAHLCLGMAQLELDQTADAESHMRRALELHTRGSAQYRGYRFYLGDLLERKGDLEGALAEYNRELEEYPDDDMTAQRAAELKLKISR